MSEDRYRRMKYPKSKPSGEYRPSFHDSPVQGRYYKVIKHGIGKEGGKELEGWLDHVARMYGGAVLGFIYDDDGKMVGSAAITKHADWFELREELREVRGVSEVEKL